MRRTLTLTMTLALGLFAVACSGEGSEPADTTQADTTQADTTQADQPAESDTAITISGFDFSGAETVSVGDSVTVTNEDSVGHTWTAVDGEFDSGSLAEGESFDFTFEEAGEFDYFCSVHPEMTGTITVEG